VLRYEATEEVGMRYLSDDKNPNELYPLSLLQEIRSNQNSPEKSDFKEKKDNQSQSKPEERIALPLNPEKDGVLQLQKDIPKDPNALPQNSEKSDSLMKKFNNKLLELNNKINFLLKPKDPHALLQNPKKSDLLEDNQLKHKPEDPQVLGNPKVKQVPETDKKQYLGQNIKKSLLSVKELFQPRKQTELENNPAEKNEPNNVEKCVINGKTFPIYNEGFPLKLAAVNYNVWESIGKPKIDKLEYTFSKKSKKIVPLLGQIKIKILINNKKSIIPILVINNPSSKDAKQEVNIVELIE
jgi:hypothetical protein